MQPNDPAQPGSTTPGYPAPSDSEPNYGQSPGYQPAGYQPPGYQPAGYQPPGYQPVGYQLPGYPPPPGYGYGYAGPRVPHPVGWLVVAWLFFWPFGIWALVGSFVKIAPAWFYGDHAAAEVHAKKVRRLGQVSLAIGLVLAAGFITLVAVTAANDKCGSADYVAAHASECVS
jgi:hypothetical protein